MTTESKFNELQEIGRCAYESVAEMVAALECDYELLHVLRDDRETWVTNIDGDEDEQNRTAEEWAQEFPDEAEELAELESAAGDCEDEDDARQRIDEDPLSLQVRSGWHSPGESGPAEEFELLLGTGGPAVRIIGELDEHGEPIRATLQAQDWFQPWTDYLDADQDVLLAYCRNFYYGE